MLDRRGYPEPVAIVLAEAIALTSALGGALKFDGTFTLQAVGDGPIKLLLADMTSAGALRGYAQCDTDRLSESLSVWTSGEPIDDAVPRLLGAGHLAFTVDQGPHTERYQGLVELVGDTLTACAEHYLRHSEQIDAGITVAAGRVVGAGGADAWRAAALMIQRMPETADTGATATASDWTREETEDGWRRSRFLMDSVTLPQLLDPELTPDELLYRLFHEEAVRVYRTLPLTAACRCSRARVARTLRAMPHGEVAGMTIDGEVIVTCEFCGATYAFDDLELAELYAT